MAEPTAAEPASGEANRCCDNGYFGDGHDCQKSAPPPPPTQGEEATARALLNYILDATWTPVEPVLAHVAVALRQRADEATEACATFLEDEAQREGDDHSAFTLRQAAAAIRARIAKDKP